MKPLLDGNQSVTRDSWRYSLSIQTFRKSGYGHSLNASKTSNIWDAVKLLLLVFNQDSRRYLPSGVVILVTCKRENVNPDATVNSVFLYKTRPYMYEGDIKHIALRSLLNVTYVGEC